MTLRKVLIMAEGKSDSDLDLMWAVQDDAWDRLSYQLAMAYNVAAGDPAKSKKPEDFNEHRKWLESLKSKHKR